MEINTRHLAQDVLAGLIPYSSAIKDIADNRPTWRSAFHEQLMVMIRSELLNTKIEDSRTGDWISLYRGCRTQESSAHFDPKVAAQEVVTGIDDFDHSLDGVMTRHPEFANSWHNQIQALIRARLLVFRDDDHLRKLFSRSREVQNELGD